MLPTRETQVLKGMAGHMYIDTQANRMKRLDGTLVDDVNFGLGDLREATQRWTLRDPRKTTSATDTGRSPTAIWDFTGKVFALQKVKDQRDLGDQRLSDASQKNLSYSQGFELLRKENQQKVSAKR